VKDHPRGGFDPKGVVASIEDSKIMARIHLETLISML
jgi:hypothetical protein